MRSYTDGLSSIRPGGVPQEDEDSIVFHSQSFSLSSLTTGATGTGKPARKFGGTKARFHAEQTYSSWKRVKGLGIGMASDGVKVEGRSKSASRWRRLVVGATFQPCF